MGLNYYASAPVLIPQPQSQHHHHQSCYSYDYNPNPNPFAYHHQQQRGNDQQQQHYQAFSAPSVFKPFLYNNPIHRLRPSRSAIAGHKRSRDDLTADEDGSNNANDVDLVNGRTSSSSPTSASVISQPIMQAANGSGNIVLNQPALQAGFMKSPLQSPTGTWTEASSEQNHQTAEAAVSTAHRPKALSRKSLRLSQSDNSIGLGNASSTSSPTDSMTATTPMAAANNSNSTNVTSQPQRPQMPNPLSTIGISWIPLTGDPALEAAARGWARYISNTFLHHRLSEVQMLLHSKSDRNPGYLVRALIDGNLRYCCFAEDLDSYQIVGAASSSSAMHGQMELVPAQSDEEALSCVRLSPLPLLERVYRKTDGRVEEGDEDIKMDGAAACAALPDATLLPDADTSAVPVQAPLFQSPYNEISLMSDYEMMQADGIHNKDVMML